MELQTLHVTARDGSGKGISRRTRREGRVPIILYGGEGDNVRLSADRRTLTHVLHGKQGEHAIVQLEVEGNPGLNSPAIVKEVQHHPVRGDVVHADFMRIRLDKRIKTMVAIKVEGRAIGVIEGGLMDFQSREVEIECLALDVPEHLIVDVSEMEIGDSVHVRDLEAPEGVEILTAAERAVVAVHAPRVVVEEVEEVEGVEGEEVEGAEAAEGEEEKTEEEASKSKE